ncbi:hypothetical protein V5O48_009985 [Marasmius crinis-equi]|uniref:Uncharacterized protein n=1 Tax=Marasmius crinis-equi TaxID=585013 RepID=A0ABR3FA10_9AGAR
MTLMRLYRPSGSSQPSVRDQICGLGLPIRQPPTKSFITHLWKLGSPEDGDDKEKEIDLSLYQTTTLHESRTMIESGTTGLRTWGASLRLAEYLIVHPELIRNKRILELGSGIGFLGIVVAILQQQLGGVSPLWLTDVNEEVLSQCRQNVSLECNLSSKHLEVHYRTLDWFDALEDDREGLRTFIQECEPEIVLGADIVFDPTLIDPLAALLFQILHKTDRRRIAIIALTVRNEETYQSFLSAVQGHGMTIEELAFVCKTPMFLETVEGNAAQNNVNILQFTTP